ncbi:MAG TPA: proline--tRNA ligase [Ktedonobacterales bacterium]|jgi:prolyl-tRNA synthetase|nr:proline--tRNA ligase [Ktedonobacterales bacterium]
MRMSHSMFRTQKRVAAEAELPSHQLILRAGLARRVSSGIYSLTPLAVRAVHHIETIIREEMDRIGGQEVLLPFVQPAELWQESERYDAMGSDLARLKDRAEHPMVLAWTHEEAVTDLARSVVESYRQLPQLVYQVQSKFRDEPRPRGGLVRLREFLMKDAYSFHASQEDLDAWYERIVEAYLAIYRRLELPILIVEADTGMMGGKSAHEFMFLADGGEDTLVVCPTGDYAANQEIAVARKGERSHKTDDEALREVHTPGATTIAALCVTLNCAPEDTLKSVFYAAGDELILALIRGDLEVNEVKLRNLLHQDVRALSREEAAAFGLVAGYAGPVGLSAKARIVVDDSVPEAGGLISGANRMDHHLAGVTYGRDYSAEKIGDIAVAAPGMACVRCGTPLEERRGIEAANIFKLGTRYSETMNARYLDERGASQPMVMGCYGLGITRALACILEQHRDADGIVWPHSVAPFTYHLLSAGMDEAICQAAEAVYTSLGERDTLYDDRALSAGVKLKDADLLGMPLRITVSARSLAAGGAELRLRASGETRIAALDDAAGAAEDMLASLSS